MRGRMGPATPELEALTREALSAAGPWPAISIWHGTADQTVVPANSDAILRQWLVVHGLQETPTFTAAA
jgi:poly(3-hydroxybutyrate) depolymerase